MSIKQKFQTRRAYRQYQRALQQASPRMRNELSALAAHQNYNH